MHLAKFFKQITRHKSLEQRIVNPSENPLSSE